MQQFLTTTWRFARNIVLIELGIFALVGLVCWLGGWRTLYHYSNGLLLAGGAALALGAYSISGSWNVSRSFDYQYAASAGVERFHDSARREMKESGSNYAFVGLMCVIGLLPIAAGVLIQVVFGF
jgi:hypothetical protein